MANLKRVTYRITVTMGGNITKKSAKREMEDILEGVHGVMLDPFVQVMQVDDISNEVK